MSWTLITGSQSQQLGSAGLRLLQATRIRAADVFIVIFTPLGPQNRYQYYFQVVLSPKTNPAEKALNRQLFPVAQKTDDYLL